MVLIRRCEEQLARSHQRGLIHGACHTYVGQEAIAAGRVRHLQKDDVVFSTHRGHGHALAKGLCRRASCSPSSSAAPPAARRDAAAACISSPPTSA